MEHDDEMALLSIVRPASWLFQSIGTGASKRASRESCSLTYALESLTMAINEFLKTQSVLALVASDFSYASDAVSKGATLKSFADNDPDDEQAFPTKLLASFPFSECDLATSPFHSKPLCQGLRKG